MALQRGVCARRPTKIHARRDDVSLEGTDTVEFGLIVSRDSLRTRTTGVFVVFVVFLSTDKKKLKNMGRLFASCFLKDSKPSFV